MSAEPGFSLRNELLAELPGAFFLEDAQLWAAPLEVAEEFLRSRGLTWYLEPHPDGGYTRRVICFICGEFPTSGYEVPFVCDRGKHRAHYDELEELGRP